MHKNSPTRAVSLLPLLTLVGLSFATPAPHDTEWPPAPDPKQLTDPVAPGLAMGRIEISMPSSISSVFNAGSGGEAVFTFGDLQGADDGGVDILMYKRNRLLVAASLNVNWAAGTGSITPLWIWSTPPLPPGTGPAGADESNCLIYDVDGDGENEVVFHFDSTQGRDQSFCVEADPAPAPGPYPFGAPPPRVVAQTPFGWGSGKRFSRVRMSDTVGPMEIAVTAHGKRPAGPGATGNGVEVWSLDPAPSGSTYPYVFNKIYETHTQNTINYSNEETHEFNAFDIDEDGFDEFFIDGIIDFVDADATGAAVQVNGMFGEQLWASGATTLSHQDAMFAADWDPNHPGFEVKGVPTQAYVDINGVMRQGVDTLYDISGNVIHEGVNVPALEGQSIVGGNFTATRPGFESIQVPKKAGVVDLPCHSFVTGCYISDHTCEPLATDGMNWFDNKNPANCPNPLPDPTPNTGDFTATGPSYFTYQVDWDGDYNADEILDYAWRTLNVWRLGEKGDWLPGSPPAGMPTQAQLTQPVCYTGGGCDYVFFYQGAGGNQPTWNWNNGGVGRYTHYFQKLGEQGMGSTLWRPLAFDLGLDHREEVTAIIRSKIHILYNSAANPSPNQRISPRHFAHYRQHRNDHPAVVGVFDYQTLPKLDVDELMTNAGLNPASHDVNGVGGSGNGLLDAYEIGLLFRVLQDPVAWQMPAIEAAWNANVSRIFAESGAVAVQAESLILAAAFATLGDLDSFAAASSLSGLTLNSTNYDLSQSSLLSVSGDLDADAVSNLGELALSTNRDQFYRIAMAPTFGTIMSAVGLPATTLDVNSVDNSSGSPVYFQANGMGDEAELALLTYLLYDEVNWLQELSWGIWNQNMTQMLADASASTVSLHWQVLSAGYLSLGDGDSQDTAREIMSLLGVVISTANYSATLELATSRDGDADMDSLSNLTEYNAVGGAAFAYFGAATTPDFNAALTTLALNPNTSDFNATPLGSGNGVPDGYELALLTKLIEDFGATGHSPVKAAFYENLAQLYFDAGSFSVLNPTELLYFGGILTLGDVDSIAFTGQFLGLLGIAIDPANYNAAGDAFISIGADPDGDGRTNLIEFQNSVSQADYVARALDPAL